MTATTGIWPGFLSARERTLYGGFCCEITCDELNEWTELLQEKGLYQRIYAIEANAEDLRNLCRLKAITQDALDSESSDNFVSEMQLRKQCYDLAKDWYAGIQKRRAEARDKENQALADMMSVKTE
jgi:hypothetical protein